MGLIGGIVFLVLKVCTVAGSLVLQESSGNEISPSPSHFSAVDPIIKGSPHPVIHEERMIRNSHSPTPQPNPSPHFESASAPRAAIGRAPSSPPITPLSEPPHAKDPVLPPDAAVPVVSPPSTLPRNSSHSPTASAIPPSSLPAPLVRNAPPPDSSYESTPPTKYHPPPSLLPVYPPPLGPKSKPRHHDYAPPPLNPGSAVPPFYTSISPAISPSTTSPPVRTTTMPFVSHPSKLPQSIHHNSSTPPSVLHEPHVSPVSTPPGRIDRGRDVIPVSTPPSRTINITPTQHNPVKAPYVHKAPRSYNHTHHLGVVTSPTTSHPPLSLLLLYPAPPPWLKSKPRHYALPPPNTGSATAPSHASVSPAISPSTSAWVRSSSTVASPSIKMPKKFQPIHHNSSIPPSILPGPNVSPVSTPLPSVNSGRDIVPVSSSRSRTIPMKAPFVHKASSSYNHAPHLDSSVVPTPSTKSHPPPSPSLLYHAPPPRLKAPSVHDAPPSDPSYMPTPPTKSHTPPLSSSYPPPPSQKSKPMHYAPPLNPVSSAHNAPSLDSSFKLSPPTQSHPAPSPSPLFSPPPGPMSKRRHYTPPPPNKVLPFHTPASPDISPSVTSQSVQTTTPSAHNAPSSYNHVPPLDSSYKYTPPTKSHIPHSLSPLYPPQLGPKSKPRHHVPPPPPNPASSVHNARLPDSGFGSTPPAKSHQPPLYHPPPSGSALPPFYTSVSPAVSPSATSVQTTTPSAHNIPSSYNHAPPLDSSYKYIPPTNSHFPPSLSPLYPPQPGPKSKPKHHVPPSPNPAPSVHNAHPPDLGFGSTPPPKSHLPPSLSPLYPPPPGSALPPFYTSISPAISPSATSVQTAMPLLPPKISPLRSPPKVPKPIQALPPPPPNEDCSLVTCKEPLTNTPPGMPCNCVMPMQISLSLGVALYTFFPLVSELAFEIDSGVNMKPSQVRIMGANADDQDPEKTVVLIDLVPFGEKFDDFTAHLTAQRFWLKQVSIKSSLFGDYEVLYVKYPGLPPSPPLPYSADGTNGGSNGRDNNGMTRNPLGVDVSKHRHGHKLNGGIIALIVLSTAVAVVLFCVLVWVLLFKRRDGSQLEPNSPAALPSFRKSSGIAASTTGSEPTSASRSFRSSMACTGSAKTFSLSDMEKATNNFNESQVLGEGGFGLVYSGLLDDGTRVAVKVLKRIGKQGSREFLAEVEMLSRLHHRNLVRLIGFCTDDRSRCLVYELIPNGSVQSHLHGKDKESGPLDWVARLKIALGAARGLAYLHEDSSPRVIHRDFKSSNILLEHDFTPKVSDFGLARSALDEENRHITTRVMGTFGYLAPEYAMTGHLLVKSDVYSYGVVLLELLTGRKPVDMSMPPGQENLVAWAQPLLMAPEGLPLLIDPMLLPDVPFDSLAKVVAVASMCVQTDVSHRPSMGEVVQALKLVCREIEEPTDSGSTLVDCDARVSPAQPTYSNHESPLDLESGLVQPASVSEH